MNNNNIDLVEKLKNCPRGTKLYSTIHGEVKLLEVKESDNDYPIIVLYNNIVQTFTKDGKFIIEYKDSECILFPSKDQRDWNKWEYIKLKKVKFDPNILKPFDKVLVRDSSNAKWFDVLFPLWNESPSDYRIKPEVKYRPFKTKEECWNEMHKHSDFGWIIYNKTYYSICDVTYNEITILYECVPCCFDFELCTGSITFTDGTPFGIKEN